MSNKAVYKYGLHMIGEQSVQMPSGAKILCVQKQETGICIWALVDTTRGNTVRHIEIVGTGHQLDSRVREYIGTVQDGDFVWHVFDNPHI